MNPEHTPEMCWETAGTTHGIVVGARRKGGSDQASRLEMFFAVAILVFASNVAYALFLLGDQTLLKAGESLAYSSIWAGAYLILALLVGLHFRGVLTVFARSWPVLVLISAYLQAEIIEPNSWIRLLLLFSTMTFSAWMAYRFSLAQVLLTFHYVLPMVMVIHALAAFVNTSALVVDALERENSLGFMTYAGLFAHKQQAGATFSISFIFYSLLALASRSSCRWKMLGASTSLVFLLLSGSANAIAVTVVTLDASLCLWALMRNKIYVFYLTAFTSIVMAMILLVAPDLLFTALDRSSDLTGRATLWQYWFGFFHDRILTGYGYSGFFVGGGAAEALWALDDNFHTPSFHDAYLEVGIQVGAPGLFLLLLIVLLGLVGTCLAACRSGRPRDLVFFAVFLAVCLFGIADSTLLYHNNFVTIVFLTIYFKLGIKLRLQSTSGFANSFPTSGTQLLARTLE